MNFSNTFVNHLLSNISSEVIDTITQRPEFQEMLMDVIPDAIRESFVDSGMTLSEELEMDLSMELYNRLVLMVV